MATKKKVTPKKKVMKLESYTLSLTINIGEYEYLKPEMTVKACSLEEATDFLYPHAEKLFEKFSVNKKQAPVCEVKVEKPKAHGVPQTDTKPNLKAFEVAKKHIEVATNKEALEIVKKKIFKSKNLNEDQKGSLLVIVGEREAKISDFLPDTK